MAISVQVRDESTTGETVNELTLDFLTERITVRELIRSRVYQEVKDHNVASAGRRFCGLVRPGEVEARLNASSGDRARQIDWHRQLEVALGAFERNGFMLLIDDRQMTDLDAEIELKPGTLVSFVKLVPLVGG